MKKVQIGHHLIGEEEPVFIIAEIGSNHDKNLDQAKELIRASAEAGADAVKFQSFSAEDLLNRKNLVDGRWVDDSGYQTLKQLELPLQWQEELLKLAEHLGVVFLSTPFDEEKADSLNQINMEAFKIASGDITHIPLIRHVAQYGKPVILSTGASNIDEIEEAVEAVKKEGNDKLVVLHCVSNYPVKFEDCNIRAINSLRKQLILPVGLSDHSFGMAAPLAAVTLGACVIEKHITFDRNLEGPDHSFAVTVDEFGSMVVEIRRLEKVLGSEPKQPTKNEIPERKGARRSIYAKVHINKGELLTRDHLKIVRHNYGMAPKEIDSLIGQRAKKAISKDELITLDAL